MKVISTLSLVLLIAGCDIFGFNDLKDQAPATRIDQNGSIETPSFGQPLIGLVRPDSEGGGGMMLLGGFGSGKIALQVESFSRTSRDSTSKQTDADRLRNDAEALSIEDNNIGGFAIAPTIAQLGVNDVSTKTGPFAYVGAPSNDGNSGKVIFIELLQFTKVDSFLEEGGVPRFGTAVASAAFGAAPFTGADEPGVARGHDLVVTAKGQLWLYKQGTGADWPSLGLAGRQRAQFTDFGAINLSDSLFENVVAFDQDGTTGDEVIFASPDDDYVAMLSNFDGCFGDATDDCTAANFTLTQIQAPQGASGFGSSLLVADIDSDGDNDLLIGASDSSQVFLYRNADITSTPEVLTQSGATGFGKAMVYGRVVGSDQGARLVVSAPSAAVGTVATAGKIYIYGANDVGGTPEEYALKTASTGATFGNSLTIMPFSDGQTIHHVLGASIGLSGALAFFSGFGENHKDPRAN